MYHASECDYVVPALCHIVRLSNTAVRVRLKIIRNARIKNVCQSDSCVVYQLQKIFKRTRILCIHLLLF